MLKCNPTFNDREETKKADEANRREDSSPMKIVIGYCKSSPVSFKPPPL
jgi:hypothetical protein